MAKYKIFTDSCSDLSTAARKESGVEYFRMNIVLDGEEKPADLDWNEYSYDEFYGWMYAGRKIKTTQVPVTEFVSKMLPWVSEGYDILYLSCSSKLSGSINMFELAKEQVLEQFPDRKLIGVDSQTATGCEGMLAIMAANLQKKGKSIEEVEEWLINNRNKINQWATVDDLKYLKNAGRIKGAKAFIGNLVGIKPIIISDKLGNNLAIKNVRGTKASLEEIFQGVKKTYDPKLCDTIWVGCGKAEESAAKLEERFQKELGAKVKRFLIGPIIGTSCGPGVVCGCCFGAEVTRYEGDGIKE